MSKYREHHKPAEPAGVRVNTGFKETMVKFRSGEHQELKAALRRWEIEQDFPYLSLRERNALEFAQYQAKKAGKISALTTKEARR